MANENIKNTMVEGLIGAFIRLQQAIWSFHEQGYQLLSTEEMTFWSKGVALGLKKGVHQHRCRHSPDDEMFVNITERVVSLTAAFSPEEVLYNITVKCYSPEETAKKNLFKSSIRRIVEEEWTNWEQRHKRASERSRNRCRATQSTTVA